MQGRKCSKGMSKSEMGLRSLSQGSQEGVWNGEGQGGRAHGVPKTELSFVDRRDTW